MTIKICPPWKYLMDYVCPEGSALSFYELLIFRSDQISCSVVSDSLRNS